MAKTTWAKEILNACDKLDVDPKELIVVIEGDLNKEFNAGYGSPEGDEFTCWTNDYVFFPVVYDGAECVGYVRRNPEGSKPSQHLGGW